MGANSNLTSGFVVVTKSCNTPKSKEHLLEWEREILIQSFQSWRIITLLLVRVIVERQLRSLWRGVNLPTNLGVWSMVLVVVKMVSNLWRRCSRPSQTPSRSWGTPLLNRMRPMIMSLHVGTTPPNLRTPKRVIARVPLLRNVEGVTREGNYYLTLC